MLAYCSTLLVRPSAADIPVLAPIADWLNRKTGAGLTPAAFVDGFSKACRDNQQLECARCDSAGAECFAIQLRHPDAEITGREWLTDIGGRLVDGTWHCSVSLGTHETSRYVPPVEHTTRPRVVLEILDTCVIDSATVGGPATPLTVADCETFEYRITDPTRTSPLLVVSCTTSGEFIVNPDRLASLLIGIAEVAYIPHGVDTHSLERLLGPSHCAYGGAVSIIWHNDRARASRIHTSKLIAPALIAIRAESGDLESEILAKVCHRCNAANARVATTLDTVRRAATQARLAFALSQGQTDAELKSLYEDVEKEQLAEIRSLKCDLDMARDEVSRLEEGNDRLEQQVDALNQSIAAVPRQESAGRGPGVIPHSQLVRLLADDMPLERCIEVIEMLYPDRVVFLQSARDSAVEQADFKHPRKALELMARLCNEYWCAISAGSDQEAKGVFGNAYAPNESETARNNKRARALRTFQYKGVGVEMMKHLKIGVKESVSETWRLHFHWDAVDKKIIIGHCGIHLDHR